MRALLFLVLVLAMARPSPCARILGINPTPSISHQKPYLVIMRALAERGHDVTMITTDPIKDPPKTLRQIDMSFTYPKEGGEEFIKNLFLVSPIKLMELFLPWNALLGEVHFNHTEIKQLMQSQEKFDVVILETAIHWYYFGFIHKLGAPPVVGFVSVGMNGGLNSLMGHISNPSYMPEGMWPLSDHMSFWQRLQNTLFYVQGLHSFYNVILPYNDQFMRRQLGVDLPSLYDMVHNVSLMIATNNFAADYPRPQLPNVVEVVGLHVDKQRKPLPADIQKFLDGAKDGVIYFSLGSNMKSSYLPTEIKKVFVDAFSELPQRVLWKFEDTSLSRTPDNVMISPWLSQQDVLAHPKVRLFITQGGLQSFHEASYFGVPLLGIPCFGDQPYNVQKMVSAGIGERMELSDITKESVLGALRRLLGNPSYADNMRRFSAVFREHQETSLERAVWWVEYVVRHRGAPHLRSAALELRWWQQLLLDVVGTLLTALLVSAFLLYKFIRCLVPQRPREKLKKP